MSHPAINWKFTPHPLVRGGHLQSILGIHWPRQVAPYQATQHSIPLGDGDQLVLHEDVPVAVTDATPSVLLIHGLGGCHQSAYMSRMAEKLTAGGYRAFRLDMRGCGAGAQEAKLPNHCGRSTDLSAALHYIAELYPESGTSVVAYSMGGTLTLNLLAETGEMRVGNLERAFVICPPLDLAHVEQHFRTFWGRRYDKFFVSLIWDQIVNRWQRFPEIAPAEIPKRPKRMRDIDELVIAPVSGFDSAEDYYAQASPAQKLAAIKQPLTIIFAEDDPVVPVEPLFQTLRSDAIEVVTTRHGGHLGFLGANSDDPDFRWLDWRILDWLAEGCTLQVSQEAAAANVRNETAHSSPQPHLQPELQTQPR